MLLVPLFLLIFAGTSLAFGPDLSSQDQLRQAGARVLAIVDDPTRRVYAEQTIASILSESKRFHRVFSATSKEIQEQYQDHAASEEEAFFTLNQLNTEWEYSQEHMADLQFDLRRQLTEDEWNEVYRSPE